MAWQAIRGKEAALCFVGHALTENRHGLVVDGRATRNPGSALSQRARQRIEEAFAWIKEVAPLRRARNRDKGRIGRQFTPTACNLIGSSLATKRWRPAVA